MTLAFSSHGVLAPGDYPLSLDDLEHSVLVVGPQDQSRYSNWNTPWRLHLVKNLGVLVRQLWHVGITEIYIDGSFVEDKERPNDIDGYFECELMRLASGDL